MKRRAFLGLFGALLLGGSAAFLALAEEETIALDEVETETEFIAPAYDYDTLVVGTPTPFGGSFSTSLFGNVTSDLDVRALLHGYNLVEWRSEDSSFGLDPSVVSSITVTENGEGDRTYLITLYDNLFYNDGTRVTAWDYAFSTLLSIAPEAAEIGAATRDLSYLIGYDAYERGEADALAGLRVLTDDTLSFTVSHEYLPFFYELALLDCVPYPIGVIAPGCEVRDDGAGIYIANIPVETPEGTAPSQEAEEPIFTAELLKETLLDPETGYVSHPAVTSGPYSLDAFDGVEVTLSLNPYYKGNSEGVTPAIEHLVFRTVGNADAVEAFESGEVGLLNKMVSAETLTRLMGLIREHADVWTMANYPRSGLSFLSFCTEKETVADEQVRQAIAMCLDKDALVRDYVGSYGLRADGYYGMGQWMSLLIRGTMPYPVQAPAADADDAAQKEYEEALEAWDAVTLDDMPVYELDVDAANALLDAAGWTLNEDGELYDPAVDAVRCKYLPNAQAAGEDAEAADTLDAEEGSSLDDENMHLAKLELTLLVPEGNAIVDSLETSFGDNLAEAGILLTVEETPGDALLSQYYSAGERDCEMIYLASNFDVVFDPSQTFRPMETAEGAEAEGTLAGEEANAPVQEIADEEELLYTQNPTHISDQELYDLAVDMRRTQPGDTLSYMQKWVAFQERFATVLPVIPIYSNVYFDFYPRVLQGYDVASHVSWGQAIVDAYLSDAADLEEETEGEPMEAETEIELIG